MSLRDTVWQKRGWEIMYEHECSQYECGWGPTIDLERDGRLVAHYHLRRFWGRNRTALDCVGLALKEIARIEGLEASHRSEVALLRAVVPELLEGA